MIKYLMLNRYELILMNETIKKEEFAKKCGLKSEELGKIMNDLNIKSENISIELAKKITSKLKDSNLKIIDDRKIESRIFDLKEVLRTDQRIPVVGIMGHIDHGKTTLVYEIMSSKFVEEDGGITQNVSLHKIKSGEKEFFLIDTPGHKIFSSLRKFIIDSTDILVLIVAADSGVEEQAEEIIKQSENTEKIICINKIDKGEKNIEKIKSYVIKKYQY